MQAEASAKSTSVASIRDPESNAGGNSPQIIAYNVGCRPETLVPGRTQRQWMDETPDRFAYRCLPLVVANQMGWDVVNPVSFRARWLGGAAASDIQLEADDSNFDYVNGHFGNGVLTFQISSLFRTPPGTGLLVSGPPNAPKDGLYALTGFVETDWTHATFTMNYLFTRSWHWVEFAVGESFCRLIPVAPQQIEELQAVQVPLDEAPKLARKHKEWSAGRNDFNRNMKNPWSQQATAGWQKKYFQGLDDDGTKLADHRTHVRLSRFTGATGPSFAEATKGVAKAGASTMSPADVLWHDQTCFATRQQKQANVLVGIAHVLRRSDARTDDEQVFLDSFDRFIAADPDIVYEVLTEPRMYCWTRLAFALLDVVRNNSARSPFVSDYCEATGESDLASVLGRHLRQFPLFELSAAMLSKRDCRFPSPLRLQLPTAIPGTRICLEGIGEASISGFVNGQLFYSTAAGEQQPEVSDESAATELPVWRSPCVEYKGWRLRMQPQAAVGLGLAAADACLRVANEFQRTHAELIRRAMESIERYASDCFEQMSATTKIVGLKPIEHGEYTNVSFSELPGLMLLSVIDNPQVMADRMIHEFHHNRLFHLEDHDAILDPAGPADSAFYSPWRDDPRPLRGVLHGLYVYIAVGRYWLNIWRSVEDVDIDRAFVADQSRRVILQCRKAQATLADNAVFTPLGEGLFSQIRVDIETLEDAARLYDVPADTEAWTMSSDGRLARQISHAGDRVLTVNEAVQQHHESFKLGSNR